MIDEKSLSETISAGEERLQQKRQRLDLEYKCYCLDICVGCGADALRSRGLISKFLEAMFLDRESKTCGACGRVATVKFSGGYVI